MFTTKCMEYTACVHASCGKSVRSADLFMRMLINLSKIAEREKEF